MSNPSQGHLERMKELLSDGPIPPDEFRDEFLDGEANARDYSRTLSLLMARAEVDLTLEMELVLTED